MGQGQSAGSGPGLPPPSAAPAPPSFAPPAPSASADPSYLAYLRGVGVEEAGINNVLATRVGALTRQLGRALPAYADKQTRMVENAGNAAESRGMFRSSGRMRDQYRAAADVDRERQDYEAQIRDQIAELYANNALNIARIRQGLTEQGFTGAQNVDIGNAKAGL